MHERCLLVGGLVALGFDATGRYLLAVSHSGRGVFDTLTWERVARDTELAYPRNGIAIGIGPIKGERIPVHETDRREILQLTAPNGRFSLFCENGILTVKTANQDPAGT